MASYKKFFTLFVVLDQDNQLVFYAYRIDFEVLPHTDDVLLKPTKKCKSKLELHMITTREAIVHYIELGCILWYSASISCFKC